MSVLIPDVVGLQYSRTIRYRTIRTAESSPADESAAESTVILPGWVISWGFITLAERDAFEVLFHDLGGAWGSALWFDWIPSPWPEVTIGTGDGAEDTFAIPAKETTAWEVEVDAVPKTKDVDYTVSEGTGANGEDEVIFGAPPASGAITIVYTGRRLWTCRLVADDLELQLLSSGLYSVPAIELQSLEAWVPATPASSSEFPSIQSRRKNLNVSYLGRTRSVSNARFFRTREWLRPRAVLSLGFSDLSDAEAESLLDHQGYVLGGLTAFNFFDWISEGHVYAPLGRGDGSTGPYVLPGKTTSNQAVYVNGVLTSGSVASGTGPNGEDEWTADSSVTTGDLISANFDGLRRWTSRYRSDSIDFKRDADSGLWTVDLELVEDKS